MTPISLPIGHITTSSSREPVVMSQQALSLKVSSIVVNYTCIASCISYPTQNKCHKVNGGAIVQYNARFRLGPILSMQQS